MKQKNTIQLKFNYVYKKTINRENFVGFFGNMHSVHIYTLKSFLHTVMRLLLAFLRHTLYCTIPFASDCFFFAMLSFLFVIVILCLLFVCCSYMLMYPLIPLTHCIRLTLECFSFKLKSKN